VTSSTDSLEKENTSLSATLTTVAVAACPTGTNETIISPGRLSAKHCYQDAED